MKSYNQDNLIIHNADCMEIMNQYEDNYFDIAIVDPPYGIGEKLTSGGTWANKYSKKDSAWDIAPKQDYFDELQRVSKNYIVWGGNYFSHNLTGSRCFIVWRKLQMLGMHTMADCELALTSFDKNAKIWDGNNATDRIHVCQKPIDLYNWIYANYAEEGQKILDTHLGSGSNAIAAHYAKMHFVGCELDPDYYKASIERIKKETAQLAFDF